MAGNIKIVIVGIGGVGGYFGGLLAKKYFGSDQVEIIFIARGPHLKQIKTHGLKVINGPEEFTAKPKLSTDDVRQIGQADFIIICTKAYDLIKTIQQLKPCIHDKTILLPLLNGVAHVETIRNILPDKIVLSGCVYIVSRLVKAGIIENSGRIQSLFFGMDQVLDYETHSRLLFFEKILKDAGIDAQFTKEIETVVWEKFIFVSTLATATSYFETTVGQLLDLHEDIVLKLVNEISQITIAKGIKIDPDVAKKSFLKFKKLPYETTSSMYNDFKSLKPGTELNSLTGYVVQAAQELNIQAPTYKMMYEQLKHKK